MTRKVEPNKGLGNEPPSGSMLFLRVVLIFILLPALLVLLVKLFIAT
ncbi:MAG: hypothetical protein N3C12_10775 [Candidatus Binatia bacterium]|nr:hypothetical protein [Candidatus Binatia bacterium]